MPVHEEVVPGAIAGGTPELTVTVPDLEPVQSRVLVAVWLVVVAAGLAALVCALVPVGPDWLDGVGAVAIVAAYSWGLAARWSSAGSRWCSASSCCCSTRTTSAPAPR